MNSAPHSPSVDLRSGRSPMANIIAGIITCALWALLGYVLGVDSGIKKERKLVLKWIRTEIDEFEKTEYAMFASIISKDIESERHLRD